MERFVGRNKRMVVQLDCFGRSPRNDVKQKTYKYEHL